MLKSELLQEEFQNSFLYTEIDKDLKDLDKKGLENLEKKLKTMRNFIL